MTQAPNLLEPRRVRKLGACLGLCLGPREVGRAVVSLHQLEDHGVLNIRKIPSAEGKERRFRQVVERAIRLNEVTRLLVVVPSETAARHPTVVAQRLVLQDLGEAYRLQLEEVEPARIREEYLDDDSLRPSNRRLAAELIRQFPELVRLRAGRSVEQSPQIRTGKERYWSRLFLALGGALLVLRRELVSNHATT